MMLWQVSTGIFWLPLFVVRTESTLRLRMFVRRYLGWRRSARMTYRQIGGNSFTVEIRWGWPVLQVWRVS